MPDALTVAAGANHVVVGVLILAGLAFAAIAAAQNDTFYLRLATEALILAASRSRSTSCSATPGCCRSDRRCSFGLGAYLSALVLKAVPSFWLALAAGSAPDWCSASSAASIVIRARAASISR